LEQVKAVTPAFFERLVIGLLVSMGYGGSRHDAGRAIGKVGMAVSIASSRKTSLVWTLYTFKPNGGKAP
jgi:hypothetical protein